jgi:phosphoglycolate phosphatase-like HAD superfamily hydrolase
MTSDLDSIKCLLFDLDGVILDTLELKGKIFVEIFKDFPELSDRILKYHLDNGGVSRRIKIQYINEFILKRKITQNELESMFDLFSELIKDNLPNIELFPNVKYVLDELKKSGFSIFSISSMPITEAELILSHLSVRHYFNGIIDTSNGKINAIKKFISQQKLSTNEILYLGDSNEDLNAALTHNIRFILVGNSTVKSSSQIFLHSINIDVLLDLLNSKDTK